MAAVVSVKKEQKSAAQTIGIPIRKFIVLSPTSDRTSYCQIQPCGGLNIARTCTQGLPRMGVSCQIKISE
jgi:hypothetical protein